jgi:hypothetical protein
MTELATVESTYTGNNPIISLFAARQAMPGTFTPNLAHQPGRAAAAR